MDIKSLDSRDLAGYIQFTITSPSITKEEIIQHCELCAAYGFNAAMIPMCYVPICKEILKGTGVKTATFFGFGTGYESIHAKIMLMRECIALGAEEVDYAPNMSLFLSGFHEEFARETELLLKSSEGLVIKPMLELGFIKSHQMKIRAIRLLDETGITWIKNSSGAPLGGGPATEEDIRLLRKHVRPECKVKASGKVGSFDQMVRLFAAGAELVGSSNAVDIVERSNMRGTDY